jgi:hypothetical protein
LDGDGFILQVHGVFTRIRSGATLMASSGSARCLAIYSVTVEAAVDGHLDRSIPAVATAENEKP